MDTRKQRQKRHQKCRSSAHCSWGTCRSDSSINYNRSMPEDLKLSQIGSSQLPPPFRGLHSPGVRKHSNYLCLLFPEIVCCLATLTWRANKYMVRRGCSFSGVYVPCIYCVPAESYRRRLGSLLLSLCDVFRTPPINCFVSGVFSKVKVNAALNPQRP